jgi:hypothetical protein
MMAMLPSASMIQMMAISSVKATRIARIRPNNNNFNLQNIRSTTDNHATATIKESHFGTLVSIDVV